MTRRCQVLRCLADHPAGLSFPALGVALGGKGPCSERMLGKQLRVLVNVKAVEAEGALRQRIYRATPHGRAQLELLAAGLPNVIHATHRSIDERRVIRTTAQPGQAPAHAVSSVFQLGRAAAAELIDSS